MLGELAIVAFALPLSAAFAPGSSGAAFASGIRDLQDQMIRSAKAADPSATWTTDEHGRGRAAAGDRRRRGLENFRGGRERCHVLRHVATETGVSQGLKTASVCRRDRALLVASGGAQRA